MDRFKVGDAVTFTSKVEDEPPVQRHGFVCGVVPPSGDPLEFVPKGFSLKTIDNKKKRDHESYIVLVGKRLFWPAAGKLKPDDGTEED